MSKTVESRKNIPKFIIFGLLGITLFFIPVIDSQVPIVETVNFIKKSLGSSINYIALISSIILVATYIMAKFMGVERFEEHHKTDGPIIGILYALAVVFAIMMVSGRGPDFILDDDVGGLAMSLAGSVMLTVTIAGWLVVFIMKSGVVEFIGTLLEPIMRPLFKLPGQAAIDALASFVSSPAIAVYITDTLYQQGVYTEKETIAILTNFSVCSIGMFGVLVSIADIVDLYPHVVLTSLIITFIMAMIIIRIPPISRKKNVYITGEEQTIEEKTTKTENLFSRAFSAALEASSELTVKAFWMSLWDAIKFAQKIVSYVISIAVLVLIIAEYTPVFIWLGKPIVPLLKLMGLPNAVDIAPATIVGVADIAFPAMIIAGKNIALKSVFFVAVLSTVQIIFFTESANAMLESAVSITVLDLLIIFIIRTLIAIPLVAVAAHLLF